MTNFVPDSLIDLCTDLGSDINLVQGAGGNISLKQGNDFWIKASGTWLADAKKNAERALVTVDTDVPTSGYKEEQLKTYKNFIRSQAYFVLGTAAFKAKNWPEAETNLKKSIDALPEQPDVIAVYRLTLALDFQNKIPEALKAVQQAVDLTKDNPDSPAGKAARQEQNRLMNFASTGTPSTPPKN